MRAFGLERRILLLVLLSLVGGLIPGAIRVLRAHRDLREMRQLNQLADVVWKLGDPDAHIDAESTNWNFFKHLHRRGPEEGARQFHPDRGLCPDSPRRALRTLLERRPCPEPGGNRAHLSAVHDSPEWNTTSQLLAGHGKAALENTAPPIASEAGWGPSWLFLPDGLNAEIKALREDFTATCADLTESARQRRLWSSLGHLADAAGVLWLALRLGRSISRPVTETTRDLLAGRPQTDDLPRLQQSRLFRENRRQRRGGKQGHHRRGKSHRATIQDPGPAGKNPRAQTPVEAPERATPSGAARRELAGARADRAE